MIRTELTVLKEEEPDSTHICQEQIIPEDPFKVLLHDCWRKIEEKKRGYLMATMKEKMTDIIKKVAEKNERLPVNRAVAEEGRIEDSIKNRLRKRANIQK
uniref:Uncharacterized protein n=1 Tax=Steinernema glaseri TaxID=37863 RepID=A0A1I7YZ59_9BILA